MHRVSVFGAQRTLSHQSGPWNLRQRWRLTCMKIHGTPSLSLLTPNSLKSDTILQNSPAFPASCCPPISAQSAICQSCRSKSNTPELAFSVTSLAFASGNATSTGSSSLAACPFGITSPAMANQDVSQASLVELRIQRFFCSQFRDLNSRPRFTKPLVILLTKEINSVRRISRLYSCHLFSLLPQPQRIAPADPHRALDSR